MNQFSRRTLLKGGVVGGAVGMTGAFAPVASAQTSLPAPLAADFYQPLYNLPGTATDVYVRVWTTGTTGFRLSTPISLQIDLLHYSGPDARRWTTRALSSFGTVTELNTPTRGTTRSFQWTLAAGTTISIAPSPSANAVFGISDGITGAGRQSSYMRVTGEGLDVSSIGHTSGPFRPTGIF